MIWKKYSQKKSIHKGLYSVTIGIILDLVQTYEKIILQKNCDINALICDSFLNIQYMYTQCTGDFRDRPALINILQLFLIEQLALIIVGQMTDCLLRSFLKLVGFYF